MSFITVALVFNIYCVSRAENNVVQSSEGSLFIYIYIHIYIYTCIIKHSAFECEKHPKGQESCKGTTKKERLQRLSPHFQYVK